MFESRPDSHRESVEETEGQSGKEAFQPQRHGDHRKEEQKPQWRQAESLLAVTECYR